MRKICFLATALLLLAVSAGPASGQTPPLVPTFKSSRVYLQCAGDLPLQNVNAVEGHTSWSTSPPPGSVFDGYGCGHVEWTPSGPNTDLIMQGTFTGNIDRLTVHLHEMAHSDQNPNGTLISVTLAIDGVERLRHLTAQRMAVNEENSGVTNSVVFTIDGLKNYYATELGNGTTVRTVTLTIDAPRESPSFWVWGTTEVPAGVTFNPLTPSPTVFTVS